MTSTQAPTMPETPAVPPVGRVAPSTDNRAGRYALYFVAFWVTFPIMTIVGALRWSSGKRDGKGVFWWSLVLPALIVGALVVGGLAIGHSSHSASDRFNELPSAADGHPSGGGQSTGSNPGSSTDTNVADSTDRTAYNRSDAYLVKDNPTQWLGDWFSYLEVVDATHDEPSIGSLFRIGSTAYNNALAALRQFPGDTPLPVTNVTATVDQTQRPALVLNFTVTINGTTKSGLVALTSEYDKWVVGTLVYTQPSP